MTPTDDAETLRRFFAPDGRLHTMPTRHVKGLFVLDRIAQRFEPGWRYDEREVDAVLKAIRDRNPRCTGDSCTCRPLYSEAGLMADFSDPDEVPENWRGRSYPDHYDVALDVETGVVVRCLPVGGPDAPSLEIDILEVDAVLDAALERA